MKEIWKSIKNYESFYEVSNHGRVRSLDRTIKNSSIYGGVCIRRGKYLRPSLDEGYPMVVLSKGGIPKTYRVYQLVWDHFGDKPRNGRELQIDHIDNNKKNSKIENLQLLTQRENLVKYHQTYNKLPPGIRFRANKFEVSIYANRKQNYLGRYGDLDEAIKRLNDFFLKKVFKHRL